MTGRHILDAIGSTLPFRLERAAPPGAARIIPVPTAKAHAKAHAMARRLAREEATVAGASSGANAAAAAQVAQRLGSDLGDSSTDLLR